MFQIESGIPRVQNAGGKLGRGRKPTAFPFADMKVGDSFLVPIEEGEDSVKKLESWRRKLALSKKRFNEGFPNEAPWQFRSAVVPGGMRVWRTA